MAKPDIDLKLLEEDQIFVQDQKTGKHSTLSNRDKQFLVCLEQKTYQEQEDWHKKRAKEKKDIGNGTGVDC